jgi:enoyl-CoA hydratase/carnithine racemase
MTVLTYERSGLQATLTLHRPERRNALSPELIEALHVGLARAKADPEVRVIVLTGEGDQAFCAGGDLGGGLQGDGFLAGHEGRARFAELFPALMELGKPVIGRIQGDALGGGLGLALACDLVVAVDSARFGTPEVKLGLFPWVIMATLARNLPRKAVLELLLLGEKVDAAQALAWGMVNRVVPRDRLDATVAELATRAASFSPAVVRLGRGAYYQMDEMALRDALPMLTSMLSLNTMLEDAGEGVSAFLGKRAPEWKGR